MVCGKNVIASNSARRIPVVRYSARPASAERLLRRGGQYRPRPRASSRVKPSKAAMCRPPRGGGRPAADTLHGADDAAQFDGAAGLYVLQSRGLEGTGSDRRTSRKLTSGGRSGSTLSGMRTGSSNPPLVEVRPITAREVTRMYGGVLQVGKEWSADSRPRLFTGGQRPKPAGRIAPKQPDGEPPLFLFRFYEAAVRNLTHPVQELPVVQRPSGHSNQPCGPRCVVMRFTAAESAGRSGSTTGQTAPRSTPR